MDVQQDQLQSWIGHSERVEDTIYPTPVVALTATLDHPATPVAVGTPLPRLWHWLYFCRRIGRAKSAPMVTPNAAASFRRFPCLGACGLAANSSFVHPSV